MRAKRAIRALVSLRQDNSGATVLEFALIAAPFFALLTAILQTSLVFFAQQALDTAAQLAARRILTGAAQQAGMSKAQFGTMACSKLPEFMQCSKLTVDVQTLPSFAAANMANPTVTMVAGTPTTPSNYAPGAPGDIVMVRLSYPWSVLGGPLGFDISNMGNGQRLLVATSLARTEPY